MSGEPGYDFTKLRQSDQISRVIERTCDSVLSNWNARELIRMRMKGNKKFDKRRRSIMYDTDGVFTNIRTKPSASARNAQVF
ncbi:MAG: hypothetical protein R2860_12365 [Desulfobacterales bacterium]